MSKICHLQKQAALDSLFEGLPSLDEVERRYVIHVLKAVGQNRKRAAQVLRIDRRTLYRMLERFALVGHDEVKEETQ
jgi:DNA-binding NtrC family response regulator